jgi:hypothetical protein
MVTAMKSGVLTTSEKRMTTIIQARNAQITHINTRTAGYMEYYQHQPETSFNEVPNRMTEYSGIGCTCGKMFFKEVRTW